MEQESRKKRKQRIEKFFAELTEQDFDKLVQKYEISKEKQEERNDSIEISNSR